MKKFLAIISSISVLLLCQACSKVDPLVEPEIEEFSFTYNGRYYTENSSENAQINKWLDKVSITIDMVDVFGGIIYFDETDCAYLKPEFNTVYIGEACNLMTITDGNTVPIDSVKVFQYQSGSFNVFLDKCEMHSWEHPIGGTVEYEVCVASGTFDLSLVNKNNETIELSDGIIKNISVYIQ